ncbi:hypothetical protein AAFP30_22715 [Gordonia sp. CPCC 205515]|uniref:hypothetical protein n=1 Tax=Gordonia sp. CPCC 205515 TaxID=3140791 RepID=UPI003AF3C48E
MTHAHAATAHDSMLTPVVPRWTGPTIDSAAEPLDAQILARFLSPDDHDWTNDGAATWIAGHVSGLTYSIDGPTKRLVLHNRGAADLAVLSTPRMTGTDGSVFTYLPTATSVMLPTAQSHILQSERRDGRPVLVGQILDGDLPQFLLDGPDVGDLDWDDIDSDGVYWTPGDHDFGSRIAPEFRFVDPLTHGVHYSHVAGETVIHNHGDSPIAMATVTAAGPADFLIAEPGESIPVPAGDAVHYLQLPRTDGDPTLLGVLWCAGGEVMPSALPVPSRRDYLDNRYLTPWSVDWDCGYAQQVHLDPELAGVTYQYRTGADTMTIRNSGYEPIAVVYQRGAEHQVEEIAPYSRVTLPVCASADTGQVYSLVGRRVDGQPGRGAGITSSGMLLPGTPARAGTATNYGSVVVMLGTVVYSAIPRKNLYLAWSDRRKWLRRNR